MPLKKLQLTPSRVGYSATAAAAAVATRLDGGAPKVRLDQLGAANVFAVSWVLDGTEYQYFMAFWRLIGRGSERFLLDMLLDEPQLEEYEVVATPGSLSLDSSEGDAFRLSAELVGARTAPDDAAADASIVDLYEAYGAGAGALLEQLEKTVNIDLGVPALTP